MARAPHFIVTGCASNRSTDEPHHPPVASPNPHDASRRRFLQAGLALAAGGAAPSVLAAVPKPDAFPTVLGAWKSNGRHHAGTWHPERGVHGVVLGFRAHEVVVDPLAKHQAVAIARRPGRHVVRFDYVEARAIAEREAEMHRNFNGHAVFSADGDVLYTAENDLFEGGGVIGVRDPATLVKQAELRTHGVGPHSLLRLSDGSLLIANGGVLAIPKIGNPIRHDMRPSLVRIDAVNGALLGEWHLDDPYLSIRHLNATANGIVAVALQAAHPDQALRDAAPVLALFDGKALKLVALPPNGLGGYAGDVTSVQTAEGERFVLGCSHADMLAWCDGQGQWTGFSPLKRACAVAPYRDQLLSISEIGQQAFYRVDESHAFVTRDIGVEWENHLVALSA